jgi:putative transposase
MVEAGGGPLGAAMAEANVHATKRLAPTLESLVVARPPPREGWQQHLRPDKGYDPPTGHDTVAAFQDVSHLRRFGEAKLDAHGQKTYPAHRWVVERTRAWWLKCRGLLVRDEKNASNFFGLLQLAWALMWMRLRGRLIGD